MHTNILFECENSIYSVQIWFECENGQQKEPFGDKNDVYKVDIRDLIKKRRNSCKSDDFMQKRT